MSSKPYLEAMRYVLRDVVEPFVPTVTMAVYYGTDKLINGREIKESVVKTTPRVLIGGNGDELYTMVMIDPDAPNPNDPRLQEVVSWIVTNIPGGKSCDQGTEVVSYVGPNPQVGVHRSILLLYKQQSLLDGIDALASRECFKIQGFAQKYNLGKPVGIAHYNVRRQSNKRKKST